METCDIQRDQEKEKNHVCLISSYNSAFLWFYKQIEGYRKHNLVIFPYDTQKRKKYIPGWLKFVRLDAAEDYVATI